MGVQIPYGKGQFLREEGASHCKVKGHSAVTCAKTAGPNVTLYGLWARTDPRNHELNGGPDPREKGQFWGKGWSLQSTETFCLELCNNRWTDRFAIWVVDSDEPKEA